MDQDITLDGLTEALDAAHKLAFRLHLDTDDEVERTIADHARKNIYLLLSSMNLMAQLGGQK